MELKDPPLRGMLGVSIWPVQGLPLWWPGRSSLPGHTPGDSIPGKAEKALKPKWG